MPPYPVPPYPVPPYPVSPYPMPTGPLPPYPVSPYPDIFKASSLYFGDAFSIVPCDIKCFEFALRSTPPIVYLLYGVHRQLFICFTDYTANCLIA